MHHGSTTLFHRLPMAIRMPCSKYIPHHQDVLKYVVYSETGREKTMPALLLDTYAWSVHSFQPLSALLVDIFCCETLRVNHEPEKRRRQHCSVCTPRHNSRYMSDERLTLRGRCERLRDVCLMRDRDVCVMRD